MKKRSFTSFFGAVLEERGFRRDERKRLCWRKDGPEATMFVSLQKASFVPGYYVNYNLGFNALAKGERPDIDESIADSRNPACFDKAKYIRMQDLLDSAVAIADNPNTQAEFAGMLDQQLAALAQLTTVQALSARVEQEPPLDMYVMTRLLAEIKRTQP